MVVSALGEGDAAGALLRDCAGAELGGAAGLVAAVTCASVAPWLVGGGGAGVSGDGPIGGDALELPAAALATPPTEPAEPELSVG